MGQPTWSASTRHSLPPGPPPYHFHPLEPPPAAHGLCICLHCQTYTHDVSDAKALRAHLSACPSYNDSVEQDSLQLLPAYLLQRAGAKAIVGSGSPFDMLEHDAWVQLCERLNPGNPTVTRRVVFEWLDEVVDELEKEGHKVSYRKIREHILEADEDEVPAHMWDPEGRYFNCMEEDEEDEEEEEEEQEEEGEEEERE